MSCFISGWTAGMTQPFPPWCLAATEWNDKHMQSVYPTSVRAKLRLLPASYSVSTPSPGGFQAPLSVDPATCPIVPGQEMIIEISKGHSGLGLSIVGGRDTPLVSFYMWKVATVTKLLLSLLVAMCHFMEEFVFYGMGKIYHCKWACIHILGSFQMFLSV